MTNAPSPRRSIDLNADLGEGFPNDASLLELVTSASLSCGAHAGDEATIRSTLKIAVARGVAVGAHPGYPDREHFGRKELDVCAEAVERMIREQVAALQSLAEQAGAELRFVKPHGALYNQAQKSQEIAAGVVAAVQSLGLPVLGQPGSVLETLAEKAGLRFVREGFPDRRYDGHGRLVPRDQPGAVIHDPAEVEAHVARLVDEGFDTLCIHGDAPNANSSALRVATVLSNHGIERRFWG